MISVISEEEYRPNYTEMSLLWQQCQDWCKNSTKMLACDVVRHIIFGTCVFYPLKLATMHFIHDSSTILRQHFSISRQFAGSVSDLIFIKDECRSCAESILPWNIFPWRHPFSLHLGHPFFIGEISYWNFFDLVGGFLYTVGAIVTSIAVVETLGAHIYFTSRLERFLINHQGNTLAFLS